MMDYLFCKVYEANETSFDYAGVVVHLFAPESESLFASEHVQCVRTKINESPVLKKEEKEKERS